MSRYELYQWCFHLIVYKLDLFEEFVVHKECRSLHYASYKLCAKLRIFLSDAKRYWMNKVVLVLDVSSRRIEIFAKYTGKLVVFDYRHYPTLWHSEVNGSCVSLPSYLLSKSYLS